LAFETVFSLLRWHRPPGDQRRSSRTQGDSGRREVPIRKIIDRWGHSIANAASVAAEVDRFYVYDNSVDDRDGQLVLRADEGRVVKAYGDAPAWAGPILERLVPGEAQAPRD
jgi:hypothetical protein